MSEFINRLDVEVDTIQRNVNRIVDQFQKQSETIQGVSSEKLCQFIHECERWIRYIDYIYFDHGMSAITYSNLDSCFRSAIQRMEEIRKTGFLAQDEIEMSIFYDGIQED